MKMRCYLLISICFIVSMICNAQEKNSVFLQNEFWKLKWSDKDINDEIYYFMNDGRFYNASIPLRTGIFYCLYSFGRYEYDVLNEAITLYTDRATEYMNGRESKRDFLKNKTTNIFIKNISNDIITVGFDTSPDDKAFSRQENKSVFFVSGGSMHEVDSMLLKTDDNVQLELSAMDQSEILNILRDISDDGIVDRKFQPKYRFTLEIKDEKRFLPIHIRNTNPHIVFAGCQYNMDDEDFVRLTEILEKYLVEN